MNMANILFKALVTLFALHIQSTHGLSLATDGPHVLKWVVSGYSFSERAGGWLKLHRLPARWADARQRCHAEGAVLASPLTQKLREAVVDFVLQEKFCNIIFTGVHATYSPDDYASVEGVPLSELSIIEWALDEHDQYRSMERCLAMIITSDGAMKDHDCNEFLPYVCYKKKTKYLEIYECGTDREYKKNPVTGSCYKFHRRGLSWTRAYMTCAAEGAHLAVINSEREAQALIQLFATVPEKEIFSPYTSFVSVGVRDANDGGSWMTIHGETLHQAGYHRWHAGEPNNMSQPLGELCGGLHRDGGFLDLPCDPVLYAFICEMDPPSSHVNNVS